MERYSRRSDLVVRERYSAYKGVSPRASFSLKRNQRSANTPPFHSPNIGRNVSIKSFSWTFSARPSFDPFASPTYSSCTSAVISGAASARTYLVNLILEAFSWYWNFSFAAYCCEGVGQLKVEGNQESTEVNREINEVEEAKRESVVAKIARGWPVAS